MSCNHVCDTDRCLKRELAYPIRPISVPAGGLDVALCELTYYHLWCNNSATLKINEVSNGHTTTVPGGYYNVCVLCEDVFQPLGAELNLHAPTGRLQLSSKKRLISNSGLTKLLGFSGD